MSDQTMFTNENNEQQETPAKPQPNPFEDKLKAIRNEDGEPKYKDVETALEALAASQQFIETLKTEKRTTEEQLNAMKTELEKMGNIEDFVKRISPNAQEPEKKVETPPTVKGLSEEEVRQLLEDSLTQRDKQSKAEQNLNRVVEELSKVHGDKASAYIQMKAKELNTTPAALKELASSNPTMALTLLGSQAKPSSQSSPSSINSPRTAPNTNEAPHWEKSAARGGLTNSQLMERWRQSKDYTNKRIGLET